MGLVPVLHRLEALALVARELDVDLARGNDSSLGHLDDRAWRAGLVLDDEPVARVGSRFVLEHAVQARRCRLVAGQDRLERRVLEALGLARRVGILVTGTENVPTDDADGVLLVANDLAERTTQKLSRGTVFASGATLGAATGTGYLGAAFIPGKSHHITNEAAYWLAVWYESRPAGSDRSSEPAPSEQNEASHG